MKNFIKNPNAVERSPYIVIPRCLSAVHDSCMVIIADPLKSHFLIKRQTNLYFFTEVNFPYEIWDLW